MGLQFHETMYGKTFFEHQLPRLTKAIEKLAESKNTTETISVIPFPLADEETCRRLLSVMNDSDKAEAFAKAFFDQVASDDEKLESVGFHMARAIIHNSIEEFLVAIVGCTSKSLLNIAETGTADPQEAKSDDRG